MSTDEGQAPLFTLEELVDLALCSPEIGTVNFNILRLLLHDIVEKLGIEAMPVTLGDVETNHVEHYKSYIQGTAQTPIPGVIQVNKPGFSYGLKEGGKSVIAASPSMRTPRTPKTGRDSISKGTDPPQNQDKSKAPEGKQTSPRILDATKALEDKVERLERHLDALYQLPTNQQLIGENKGSGGLGGGGGMTVNDMWQIIQLNNRVASCESAIQKMATLLEDLAQDLSRTKGDTKSFQKDAEDLMKSHSRLSMDMTPLPEKCQMVQEALDELKKDLNDIREEWKNELDKITKAVGVDPNKVPSFMKEHPDSKTHHDGKGHGGKSKTKDHKKPDGTSENNASGKTEGSSKPKRHKSPDSNSDVDSDDADHHKNNKKGPNKSKPKKKDVNKMRPHEISELTVEDLDGMSPDEAALIKPSKLVHMTPEQRKKVDEIKNKNKNKLDVSKMTPDEIASLTPSELALLTPSQAAMLTDSVLSLMTPEQQKVIKDLKDGGKDKDKGKDKGKESSEKDPKRLSTGGDHQPPSTDDYNKEDSQDHKKTTDGHHPDHENLNKKTTSKHKQKGGPTPSHRGHGHAGHGATGGNAPVDIIKGALPKNEALPPMNHDEAKDLVQAEMQKQYGQLQAMQRKMANDIHEKMEFIYDKLLKDIVTQHEGAIPYMAAGAPVQGLGPGVCTNAGMPAGVAVCQFPEAGGRHPGTVEPKVCPGTGICPASDNCPNCSPLAAAAAQAASPFQQQQQLWMPQQPEPQVGIPHAQQGIQQPQQQQQGMQPPPQGRRMTQQQQPLHPHGQTQPGNPAEGIMPMSQQHPVPGGQSGSNNVEDQMLMREMRSLILLDLEKIREDMKNKDVNIFDEQDITERLDTIWEAIKIIKNNEETLAVKILRQDAFLKKLPKETIDRIQKIPAENLEAIASAKWDKPIMLPSGTAVGARGGKRMSQGQAVKGILAPAADAGGGGSIDKEELQKIYNNLTNLIAETTDHKNKLDRIGDQVRTMEVGMVTKQMLVDALGDKADKGQINTKVSYDEFGTAIEELHTNLRELVMENFNKNEQWNRVTNDLAEGVHNKLDKNELIPVKAFFKSHLKTLADKVNHLQRQFEDPDPAGTRKKLLKDFNCISCDRHCNISGVTNAPILPVIGPILAGHNTASRRAFDLHRMRNKKKLLEDCRDLTLMEKQLKCLGLLNADGTPKRASDLDLVNRFQGGSHTTISNAARIRSQRGSKPTVSISTFEGDDEEEMTSSMNEFGMANEVESSEQLLQQYSYMEE